MSGDDWRRAYFTVLVLSLLLIPMATVAASCGTFVLHFELGRRGLDPPESLLLLMRVHPWGLIAISAVALCTILILGKWRAQHGSVLLSGLVLVFHTLLMWLVLWLGIGPYLAYTGNLAQ